MPAELKEKLEAAASRAKRSLTSEIVGRLEESFGLTFSLPQDLVNRLAFFAHSQGRSVADEIRETLDSLYPQIPTTKDILEEFDELLARAEELDAGDDLLFRKRISEHLGKLRERFSSLASAGFVDRLPKLKD